MIGKEVAFANASFNNSTEEDDMVEAVVVDEEEATSIGGSWIMIEEGEMVTLLFAGVNGC
jgi:hypothetical protein